MKIIKTTAWAFGALGAFLMGISLILCLMNLNREPVLTELPLEAIQRSEAFAQALEDGDLAAAALLMPGQPELDFPEPEEILQKRVWESYVENLSFVYTSDCYASHAGICRDAVITVLDMPGTLEELNLRTHTLLSQRVENAVSMSELYDEHNNFRRDLVDQVLDQALMELVTDSRTAMTREVTVRLVYRNGQWYVSPDQALFRALTGGVG